MIRYFGLSCIFSVLAFTACTPDPVSSFMGPMLLANSPVHFGDSPQGIRSRGRLVITNGGDTPLEINDFKIEPDDGTFQVGFSELPLKIAGRRSKEITIQFWPRAIGAFKSDLSFDSNHDGNTLTPIVLLGNGVSDQTCLPCTPPPEPECHFDRESSLVYIPSTSTDCESESGECGYRILEIPCENELCDMDTGLCPGGVIPTFDAGPGPSICGNGELENDEECDDGNTISGDGCSETCTLEEGWDCTEGECETICGDEIIAGTEECDDGNTDNDDGCSETCTLEEGWDCTESECETICGDDVIAGDEECDDGNTTTETCNYGEDTCTVCGASCTFVSGATSLCGDGLVQETEECDDGISEDGGIGNSDITPDACREDCTNPTCGDDIQDTDEECDDGNTIIEACDYGVDTCTVCGATCSFVPGMTALCGDGVVQSFEECDDGDMNSLDQPDACRENCVLAFCGDETKDTDEECDLGPNPDILCPYGDSSCFSCNVSCETIDGSAQFCGDGIIQAEEECDEGTDSATGNSDERADACRTTCVEYSCGDGFVDSNEACDNGSNLSGSGCNADCTETDAICGDAIWLTGAGGFVTGNYGNDDNLQAGNYTNGSANAASCTHNTSGFGSSDGPETVYAITLEPGETFKIDNAIPDNSAYDISIYVLDDCDTNTGTCVEGADLTVEGDEENLSYLFSDTVATNFYLIIDSWCHDDPCPTSSSTFSFTWSVIPTPACGDGYLHEGEECDDNNNLPGDGCSIACLIEDGWECETSEIGNPSVCTETSINYGGETCSDATVLNTSSGSIIGYYGDNDSYDPYDYSFHVASSCTGSGSAGGPDAVYAIELSNNANLHVEVGPQTSADISIYLLDACLPSDYSCVAGADEGSPATSPGVPESFDYTWPGTEAGNATKTFYLVVDAYCSIGSSYCPTSTDTFELSWYIN